MDGVLHRRALLAEGYTDSELQRSRRAEEIVVLRRGAYVRAGDRRLRAPEARHALLISAERERVAPEAVVSHVSAAVLYGLPVWGVPLDRVHVTRARSTGGRAGARVYVHSAPLGPNEVRMCAGMAVTSPARTLVDLARTGTFESAVVTADAALRAGLVDEDTLAEALHRTAGWRGAPAARRMAAFVDGRTESVGESRSRVALWRAGFPPPIPQWEVWQDGTMLGRVDFAWPHAGTVAEFDGEVKYGRLLRPGQDPGEVVFEEKLREDRLRAAGLTVVRWTWRDLATFEVPTTRLRRALGGAV